MSRTLTSVYHSPMSTRSDYATNHLARTLRSGSVGRGQALCLDDRKRGLRLSYADIFAMAERYASAIAQAGVKPDDRVMVQAEKSVEVMAVYLGTVLAGAAFVPLNTAYTARELEHFISDAKPALFICDPAARGTFAPIATANGATVLTCDATGSGTLAEAGANAADSFEAIPRAADDLACILYTSGTTGRSKGAMLTHANLASNAETLRDYWRFTSDDVLIHALPIFHAHGLFVAINVSLTAGGAMLFEQKFDADRALALMPDATAMMGVPTFYTRLLHHDGLTFEATAGIRVFISGSAPLPAETHRDWTARTGHNILERYGMTETAMNTSNPYDGERRPGTVGFPLPGIEIRVTEPETGAPLPNGRIGGIEIRGPNVFKGYWQMPEKTAEEFRADGFFITGDLGVISEDGYVTIVGRSKDLIISGGYNIYPKEIESLIDAIDGVVESAVFGVPHPDFGEGVVAAVVRQPDAAPDAATIIAAIAPDLAKFKQPKAVLFLDELPRNTMGKVQKNTLRTDNADVLQG